MALIPDLQVNCQGIGQGTFLDILNFDAFTSPPLDPTEPSRNLAGGEQIPPPPLPEDCLFRPPGLITQVDGWLDIDDLDSPVV